MANALEELQNYKAELEAKCIAKEAEIALQADYITEHWGKIIIKSIVGNSFKKDKEKRTEIIELLVADGIDTMIDIKQDPHHVKEKLMGAAKRSVSGILNLFFK